MRTVFLVFSLAAAAPHVSLAEDGSPGETAPKCDRITFSGYADYAPWSWVQEGRLRGVSVRIARRIAYRLGREAVFQVEGPAKRVRLALTLGKVDALTAVTKSNGNLEAGVLSGFYGVDEIAIVHDVDGDFRYRNWDDLNGLRIATTLGSSWGEALDNYLRAHSEVFFTSELDNVMRMISAGRVDAGIHRYYSILFKFHGRRQLDGVRMAYNRADALMLYYNFGKASPCRALLPQFNVVLRDLRRRGVVSDEVQKELALISGAPSLQDQTN